MQAGSAMRWSRPRQASDMVVHEGRQEAVGKVGEAVHEAEAARQCFEAHEATAQERRLATRLPSVTATYQDEGGTARGAWREAQQYLLHACVDGMGMGMDFARYAYSGRSVT